MSNSPILQIKVRPLQLHFLDREDEYEKLCGDRYPLRILYNGIGHESKFEENDLRIFKFEFNPEVLILEFLIVSFNEEEMKFVFDLGDHHPVIVEEELYGPHNVEFTLSMSVLYRSLSFYFFVEFFNIGISIEEHCVKYPLFPLASHHFQYQPLLLNIFSFLNTEFQISRLNLVNSHFRSILKDYVFSRLRFTEKTFQPSVSSPKSSVHPERWKEFENSIIRTGIKCKSLTIENESIDSVTIFQAFRFKNIESDSLLEISIMNNPSRDPLLRDCPISPVFDTLFLHVTKLQFTHIFQEDLVVLINHIPRLQFVDVADLHFPISITDPKDDVSKMNPHDSLIMVQCGFIKTEDELCLYYESVQDLTEAFAVDILEKCKNLRILEVPYLHTERLDQSVYFPGKKVQTNRRKSVLVTYLRNRFLDKSGNFIPLSAVSDDKNCGLDENEEKVIIEEFSLQIGKFSLTTTEWDERDGYVYSTERDKTVLVHGIPFRIFFQVTDDSVYAGISCPFVKFSFGLDDRVISHLDVDSTFEEDRQETKIILGDISDFGVVREKSDDPEEKGGLPLEFKWGRYVPVQIQIFEFFKTFESFKIYEGVKKKENEMLDRQWLKGEVLRKRGEREEKIMEAVKLKKEDVKKSVFVRQALCAKRDGPVEIEFEVMADDILVENCVSFFTLFDGLLDWSVEYCLGEDTPRRNLYFGRIFKGKEFILQGSFSVEVTLFYSLDDGKADGSGSDNTAKKEEEEEVEGEGEENENSKESKNTDDVSKLLFQERRFEFTSPKNYYEEDLFTRFLFCLPKDETRIEEKVRIRILDFEVMEKVLSRKEWEESIHKKTISDTQVALRNSKHIEDEIEFVLSVPRSDIQQQIGIIKIIKDDDECMDKDPRKRVIRLCGIDFYVFFTPFETLESPDGMCTLQLKVANLSSGKMKIYGKFFVYVLSEEESNNEVSVTHSLEKEVGDEDNWEDIIFKDFKQLCPVDKDRKIWRFRVKFLLTGLEWVDKKKTKKSLDEGENNSDESEKGDNN